jgi:hypothetical protein
MSEQLYEVRCPICGRSVPPQGNLLAYKCEHSTPAVPPPAEQGDANLCVFCGSESIEAIPDHDEDGPMFYVYCGRCEAQGPVIYSVPSAGHKATPEEAIKAWNTRTPQPAGEEEPERCKEPVYERNYDGSREIVDCARPLPCVEHPSTPASDARAEAQELQAHIDFMLAQFGDFRDLAFAPDGKTWKSKYRNRETKKERAAADALIAAAREKEGK